MSTSPLDPPAPDQLEISVFGPGYGESVVLHVGDGHWVLVDSCLEPGSGKPAPLQYLHGLAVDTERSVELIVATHWHDDHVRGLSDVLDECESARFVVSGALDVGDFRRLVSCFGQGVPLKSSGLDEFARVLGILDARKQHGALRYPPRFAVSNRLLYREPISLAAHTVDANVFSLSPSDASILQSQLAFAQLLPTEGERKKRIASPTPNHAAVVLWVQVGIHHLLLGSDLESTADPGAGWSAVLDDSMVVAGQAGVFKVAHHGAESAHDPRIWSELLSEDPFSLLSPFCQGGTLLPTTADIQRIRNLTCEAYITSPLVPQRHKWANRVVRDLIREVVRDTQDVHCGWGQVRLRHSILEKGGPWQVQLFGDACPLLD